MKPLYFTVCPKPLELFREIEMDMYYNAIYKPMTMTEITSVYRSLSFRRHLTPSPEDIDFLGVEMS